VNAASAPSAAWDDAVVAARLLAVDPHGLGGAWLHARPGPVRDAWLEALRAALPAGAPWRRVPLNIADSRLLGGLDLTATLSAGRPVAERGVLAEADGGAVVLPMAERVPAATAARLAQVMDAGAVRIERDGMALSECARFVLAALDESVEDEPPEARALIERVAFVLELEGVPPRAAQATMTEWDVAAARARLATVGADDAVVSALTTAAAALGVASLRAPLFALRAARAHAALAGRAVADEADAAVAARLVLAPRATQWPAPPESPEPEPPAPAPDADAPAPAPSDRALDDVVLAAARAAIPPQLLARLQAAAARGAARTHGRSGAEQTARARGRPAGTRRGELGRGARLAVVETLRAAAPWQPLRRRARDSARIEVRPDDFRITRLRQRRQTTTLFVVDASGSQALHRLAEAKGAVELLLADCYVRRDRVALIAFRGQGAQLVLSPTRSLVRAKRSLAGLPGGGGTPLAAGLDAAADLAEGLARRGDTPVVVLLTDGRANVARDGRGGRPQAEGDAHAAARRLRAAGHATLVIDTSPRPDPQAERLAGELGARYLPLPRADAQAVSRAVIAAAG
jgi:magnesium chelatase subunit D